MGRNMETIGRSNLMRKIQRIEIDFPVAIDLPDGWEQTLDGLISMICRQYEKENPDRVMRPLIGHGSKPIWNEPHEPEYDDTVYRIEVTEREDLHGSNKHNPMRDELRKKAQLRQENNAARDAKRKEVI